MHNSSSLSSAASTTHPPSSVVDTRIPQQSQPALGGAAYPLPMPKLDGIASAAAAKPVPGPGKLEQQQLSTTRTANTTSPQMTSPSPVTTAAVNDAFVAKTVTQPQRSITQPTQHTPIKGRTPAQQNKVPVAHGALLTKSNSSASVQTHVNSNAPATTSAPVQASQSAAAKPVVAGTASHIAEVARQGAVAVQSEQPSAVRPGPTKAPASALSNGLCAQANGAPGTNPKRQESQSRGHAVSNAPRSPAVPAVPNRHLSPSAISRQASHVHANEAAVTISKASAVATVVKQTPKPSNSVAQKAPALKQKAENIALPVTYSSTIANLNIVSVGNRQSQKPSSHSVSKTQQSTVSPLPKLNSSVSGNKLAYPSTNLINNKGAQLSCSRAVSTPSITGKSATVCGSSVFTQRSAIPNAKDVKEVAAKQPAQTGGTKMVTVSKTKPVTDPSKEALPVPAISSSASAASRPVSSAFSTSSASSMPSLPVPAAAHVANSSTVRPGVVQAKTTINDTPKSSNSSIPRRTAAPVTGAARPVQRPFSSTGLQKASNTVVRPLQVVSAQRSSVNASMSSRSVQTSPCRPPGSVSQQGASTIAAQVAATLARNAKPAVRAACAQTRPVAAGIAGSTGVKEPSITLVKSTDNAQSQLDHLAKPANRHVPSVAVSNAAAAPISGKRSLAGESSATQTPAKRPENSFKLTPQQERMLPTVPNVEPHIVAAALEAAAAVEPTPPLLNRSSQQVTTPKKVSVQATQEKSQSSQTIRSSPTQQRPFVTQVPPAVQQEEAPTHIQSKSGQSSGGKGQATLIRPSTSSPPAARSSVLATPSTPAASTAGASGTTPAATPLKPATIPEGMKFEDGEHVTIWNRIEQRKIAGNAAPLGRNLAHYLATHPDCEVHTNQDVLLNESRKGKKRSRVHLAEASAGEHISIWNRREKRKIAGNAAPLRKNLEAYLAKRPDWEVYTNQDIELKNKEKIEKSARERAETLAQSEIVAETSQYADPFEPTAEPLDAWRALSIDLENLKGQHADMEATANLLLGLGASDDDADINLAVMTGPDDTSLFDSSIDIEKMITSVDVDDMSLSGLPESPMLTF